MPPCSAAAAPAIAAPAAPFPKEKLLTAPAGARHYPITSSAGQHGDIWSWTLPDGRIAYRMSMNLRGWITETDEVATLGPDRRPTAIAVRGFTDQGDATESFSVDGAGIGALADGRRQRLRAVRRQALQQLRRSVAGERARRRRAGRGRRQGHRPAAGRPRQHRHPPAGRRSTGPNGPTTVKLAFITGYGFAPQPVWLDRDNHFFGNAGGLALLPDGYAASNAKLKEIQEAATADMVRDVAHRFLSPANRTPTLVDHVTLFDSVAGALPRPTARC